MAKRRIKKRTHAGAVTGKNTPTPARRTERDPKSMVIRIGAGEVGKSVSQLVKDVRSIMEPGTASRLRERKNNKLKDYIVMCGPLEVTHLLLFSRSASGNTNLRLAVTPRGPTLHFKVENYSLCKDILKAQRHPKANSALHLNHPLLVMNNFQTVPADTQDSEQQSTRRLESLVTELFRSLFPQVNPLKIPLTSVKRVLLLDREPPTDKDKANGSYNVTLRHYAINTKRAGLPKAIKRINNAEKVKKNERRGKGVPNLGQLEDVSEYFLDPHTGNYTSASESEPESDAEVEVLAPREKRLHYREKLEKIRAANGLGTGGAIPGLSNVERRGVVLSELGPRMRLQLMKVEEGLCEGKVLWHQYREKSKEEEREQEKIWEQRKKEKEERRRVQKENIDKKKKSRGQGQEEDDEDEEGLYDYDAWESDNEGDDDEMDES